MQQEGAVRSLKTPKGLVSPDLPPLVLQLGEEHFPYLIQKILLVSRQVCYQ